MRHYLQDRPRVELPSLAKGTSVLRPFAPLGGSNGATPIPPFPSPGGGVPASGAAAVEKAMPLAATPDAPHGPSVECEKAADGRITRIIVTASNGERILLDCTYGNAGG